MFDSAASATIIPSAIAAAMASTESSRVISVPSSRPGRNLPDERQVGGHRRSGTTTEGRHPQALGRNRRPSAYLCLPM